MNADIRVDRDEAVRLVTAAAFHVKRHTECCPVCEYRFPSTHPDESSDAGRTLIHTRAGGFGADWDLEAAVEFIRAADEVEWGLSLLGHDLMAVKVEDDGHEVLVAFDVEHPNRDEWIAARQREAAQRREAEQT